MKFISCDNGPNFRNKDIWIALTSVFRSNGSSLKQSKSILEERFKSTVHLYDSGRSALTHILKAFDFPENSEIIIQAYSCIVVPNSVFQAGLEPVIVDIDTSLNIDPEHIKDHISANTKAIIVQHNFGNPADMESIKKICDSHNIILIEDCAHSLGVEYTLNGETVQCGAVGDAAIFSFGRDKCISSVIGGAGVIHPRHPEVNKRLSDYYEKAPTISLNLSLRALLYPILVTGLVVPFYHIIIGKVIMVALRKLKTLPSVYTQAEKKRTLSKLNTPAKIHPILGSLLLNQLQSLDEFVEHRTLITGIYNEGLPQISRGTTYMRYPLIIEDLGSKKPTQKLYTEIKQKARAQGIFLGNWYTQLFVDNKGKEYIHHAKVPHASAKIGKVLNLPTNIRTSPEVAKKIVGIVQSSL